MRCGRRVSRCSGWSWCRGRSGRSCATWCSSAGRCTTSATAAPGSPCCALPGVARAWRRSPRSRVPRTRSSSGKRSRTPLAWPAVRRAILRAWRACTKCWLERSSSAMPHRRQTGSRRPGYSWAHRMRTRARSCGTRACSSPPSPSGRRPSSGARAREALHSAGAPKGKGGARFDPDPRSLPGCLGPALAERFQTQAPAPGAPSAGRAQALPLRRLHDAWCSPELPAAEPLPHLPLERSSIETPEFRWVGETQRHIGTVVHALLAQIADAPALPTGAQLQGQREAVLRQLRRAGVPEREAGEAASLVLTALARTLANERGRWILGAGHAEAHSELALTGLTAGRLRSVRIDP